MESSMSKIITVDFRNDALSDYTAVKSASEAA